MFIMKSKTGFKILVLFFCSYSSLYCQTEPVGSYLDAELRKLQLDGKIKPTYSLAIRPIEYSSIILNDSATGEKKTFKLLPFSLRTKFTTNSPYGWNDKGMTASNGIQALASMGVYAKYGFIDLQLSPEFIWASNSRYDSNGSYGPSVFKSFAKVYGGESAIRFNLKKLAVSLSTGNLWWGPGIYNSLLMSNTAPGFAHVNFYTKEPINTGIGSFEWQLVSGKLTDNENCHMKIYIQNIFL
jgi:hypothetical protein